MRNEFNMITVQSLRNGAQTLVAGQIAQNEAERTAALAPYQRKMQAADALDAAGFSDEATAMRDPAQATIGAANAGYDKAAATLTELHGSVDDMSDGDIQGIIDAGEQNAKRIVVGFLESTLQVFDGQVQAIQQKRVVVEQLRYDASNAVDAELEALVSVPE